MKCPQHYLTEMQEVILFYNGLDIPTRQILDSRCAIPSKTAADAKTAIKKMAAYSQKWHNGTSRTRRPHYTKDFPQKGEGKTLEEAYYTQFGGPFQGGGYRETTLGFYQRNNASPSYQERRKSMEDTLIKFMGELAKRHEENSNLIKEIRASTDVAIRNQRESIKTLEIQIGQVSKVLQERGFGSLPSSTETNPRDQVKSILTTIEADSYPIRPYSEASHIDNSIPQKEKDPWSFTLPYFINDVLFDNALVDLGASVSVMPLSTYLNLGLGELAHSKLTTELADRAVKYLNGIAENVLVGIGKFTFPVDFIILDMPMDIKVPLILGRPFLSTARAKIDVYKRKITLRVREERIIFKSVKPAREIKIMILIPTIKEGEVIKEFRARNDARMVSEIFGYLSDYDHDKKIRIDYAYNLKFLCMIVLEDMDDYRDEGICDVIFGEPFLREVGIKAKRFDGMITIYNGNDEVTYQMVRSHPRFKRHTNEQCNKISPLLKVSEEDEMNGILHAYQKLKGFYNGVLNLGPDYI
ncbi:hypothetical protein Tco_0978347 [Tanacetum coccineum]|uniref:Reverse transcriptase domain-containing protein n=1 Tax=Tanacetum coccineum TaxID=301880 RepID=A0ABQ5EMT5_9ASTR